MQPSAHFYRKEAALPVAAVTVTYGDRFHLLRHVIRAALDCGVATVIVVANGAAAGSVAALERLADEANGAVHIVSLPQNLGSAGGFKAGLEYAARHGGCDFIWLLDDDNVPEPGALQVLLAQHARLRRETSEDRLALSCYRDTRAWRRLRQGVPPGLVFPLPSSFHKFHLFNWARNLFRTILLHWRNLTGGEVSPAVAAVPCAHYGGLFLHRSVLDTCGLPDERFFLYSDDTEFTNRLVRAGGRIYLVCASVVRDIEPKWHRGVRLPYLMGDSDLRSYYNIRNRAYFDAHCGTGRGAWYVVNKHAFLFRLGVLALARRRWARYLLIRRAVRDGEAGRLGPIAALPDGAETCCPNPGMAEANADEIRAFPRPRCCLCGAEGEPLYEGLQDRLFGAPGKWNLACCPNPECGLLWLDPMPLEEDIGRAYRDYYTHEEDEARESRKGGGAFKRFKHTLRSARETGYLALRYGAANGASVPQKLAGLLVYLEPARKAKFDGRAMHLPVRPGARLLEIGCGSGRQLELLRELGWQVEGLDPDPAAVSAASARGLTIHAGSLEQQRFPDRHFDAVVSSHVIEHVHDPVALLRESGRILRPGGRIVVVTPNAASWGHRWFGASWRGLEPPRHLHLFDAVSLRQAAERAGLQVYRLASTVRGADGLFRASRDIRDTGHHVWGSRRPWAVRRWFRALQWAEWLTLQAGLDRGEELMMICELGSEDARRRSA